MEYPKWTVKRLNIGILATDSKSFRIVGWLTTGSGGIICGIASSLGSGTKLSYHTNGDLYMRTTMTKELKERLTAQGQPIPKIRPPLKYPSIPDLRGLVPFFGAGLSWHEFFPAFPFKKIDEAVYVDVRPKGGLSFNLGLLEPDAFEALNALKIGSENSYKDAHLHVITKTRPWIAIWTY
jgi:hypothetical protein